MEVVGSIGQSLLSPLLQELVKLFNDVKDGEERFHSLADDVSKLKNKRENIEKWWRIDSLRGRKPAAEALEWVDNVKKLETEATTLQVEFDRSSNGGCLCDCAVHGFKLYKLSRQAEEKISDAEKLIKDGDGFWNGEADVTKSPTSDRAAAAPAVPGGLLVGMEKPLEQIEIYMNDDSVSVIGVCGMARVGKSTILKKFCSQWDNRRKILIYFDAGEKYSVEDIHKKIMQTFDLKPKQTLKSSDETASYIRSHLREAKFLLVLDNLWEAVDLGILGIPDLAANKKGKVILSTRYSKVCNRMGAKMVRVQCIDPQNSRTLFEDKVGDSARRLMTDSRFDEQAKKLVDKCSGLPEALVNVAYAVETMESLEQWQYAVEAMETKPWRIDNMERLLSSIKESFDRLEDNLKKCLLYCSLYPEGFSIEKDWIIYYCIGEGLVEEYLEGDSNLGKLKAESLLENGDAEDQIRLHPVVRAMALWIACECGKRENRWLVQAKLDLKEAPNPDLWEVAQRISLMRNKLTSLPLNPRSPELETLLLQANASLNRVPDDFFKFMPVLKVLDLSQTTVEDLPSGISSLLNLQYLNVCDTNIKSLPKELQKLTKLRFLLLSHTPIKTIHEGVIAKLLQLQDLFVDFSYGNWRARIAWNGVDIDELKQLKKLKALGITVESLVVLRELAGSYLLAGCTRNLQIRGCDGLSSISRTLLGDGSDDLKGVQVLEIRDSTDIRELVIDRNEWYLQNLSSLQLRGLPNIKIVWNGGWFRNLSELRVCSCDGMEVLVHWNAELLETKRSAAEAVNGGRGEKEEEMSAFPYLKTLELVDLPKLRSLCEERRLALPSLEHLQVKNCPQLKKLEIGVNKLQDISGEQIWWSKLEKDDWNKKAQFRSINP